MQLLERRRQLTDGLPNMVKNSWGETGKYKGIWYMTKNYIVANTMDYLVNKKAIPADILKKMENAKKKQTIAD